MVAPGSVPAMAHPGAGVSLGNNTSAIITKKDLLRERSMTAGGGVRNKSGGIQ